MRRAMDLSASDVSAIVVEPILQALGWDTKNPKQARRPDDSSQLRLLSSGKTALTVITSSSLDKVPDSLSGISKDSGEWVIATNGASWHIFNQHNTSQPFRKVSLADAPSAREAAPVLEMLQRDAFLKDSLTEAWMSEAVDQDIERILARHLDGSEALVGVVQENLQSQGITMSSDDVRAALSRIDISLGGKSATEVEQVEVITPVEEVASETKPARKTPAKTARKTTSKPAAKKAATKPTTAKTAKPKPAKATAPASSQTKSKATAQTTEAAASKAAAKKAAKADVKLPSTPEELGWPDNATHVMHRKKNIVFIELNENNGESTILPGSLIVANLGKALSAPMIKAREQAVKSNDIAPFGNDMMQVKKPMTFKDPKAAASFSAATLVKDLGAWKTKAGETLNESLTLPKETPSPAEASAPAQESMTA